MKNLLIALSMFLVFSNTAYGFASPQPGDKTEDVAKYARTHTEFPERGFNQFNCRDCSTFKNGVFIATVSSCGSGSCDYLVFEKKGAGLTFKTLVDIRPGAFQFLTTTHNGLPDIKSYLHLTADHGFIRTLEFDGKTYKDAASKKKIAAVNIEKEITPEKVQVSLVQ